jgi:glucokinase
MILAGDIGGTHTRLALFEPVGELTIVIEKKYPSQEYKGLELIATQFLKEYKTTVAAACFGIAGPIVNGRATPPNLPWIVDARELSKTLHIPTVHLINDLQANANGLKALKSDELFLVQKGKKHVGNQALLSAGTGLGEAGLYWTGKTHLPFASEGGHVDFAPRNALEIELLIYLQKKLGHVSYERVVSGPGIHLLYDFLIEKGYEKASSEVTLAMKESDASAVIGNFGLQNKDKACAQALDWFLSLLGAEAGNVALKFLALGGLYLGGGIAPRLARRFVESDFLRSFSEKGRFKELLESIPIYIVMNDNTALLGAACFARSLPKTY